MANPFRRTGRHGGQRSATLLAAALFAVIGSAQADGSPFSIQSLHAPFSEFVESGDAVPIVVRGPSAAALRNVAIKLNGVDVSDRFSAGEPGSLVGTVPGLARGINVIAVYPSARAAQPQASVTVTTAVGPQLGCQGLTGLSIPAAMLDAPQDVVQITLAQPVAASATLPAHCRIRGAINPRIGVNNTPFAIGFELRLPDAWSGRFFFQGGGGNDGNIGNATGNVGNSAPPALARGMAAVSTDGGHTGGSAAQFGFDPQARIDHAYNAYGKTAATAKAIVDLYYGRAPAKSYFAGCSGGGRQGMMFTQRYPAAFDGVIAVAPAMRVATGASISAAWESITYRSIAPRDAAGNPILSQAFSNADLSLVSNKILESCDALDGVADGSVNNFRACRFDPKVLQCSGAKDASCLSAEQVDALKKGFGGPVDSSGKALYFPWQFDAGISAAGWRSWKLGSSNTATPNSAFSTLIQDAMRNEFFTPPDPGFSIFDFNFDTDPARMQAFGAEYDTWKDTRLADFKARGGKLMLLNGLSDPIFSALETANYMDQVIETYGPVKAATLARLFLVPGMTHCSGGPATDRFDALTPLIDWVENGNGPERIVASGNSLPGRTRPLCRYPGYAQYGGSGDAQDAASFACTAPLPR
jgi:pimeloyl-ACP methyl ester carboxylesterase